MQESFLSRLCLLLNDVHLPLSFTRSLTLGSLSFFHPPVSCWSVQVSSLFSWNLASEDLLFLVSPPIQPTLNTQFQLPFPPL